MKQSWIGHEAEAHWLTYMHITKPVIACQGCGFWKGEVCYTTEHLIVECWTVIRRKPAMAPRVYLHWDLFRLIKSCNCGQLLLSDQSGPWQVRRTDASADQESPFLHAYSTGLDLDSLGWHRLPSAGEKRNPGSWPPLLFPLLLVPSDCSNHKAICDHQIAQLRGKIIRKVVAEQ